MKVTLSFKVDRDAIGRKNAARHNRRVHLACQRDREDGALDGRGPMAAMEARLRAESPAMLTRLLFETTRGNLRASQQVGNEVVDTALSTLGVDREEVAAARDGDSQAAQNVSRKLFEAALAAYGIKRQDIAAVQVCAGKVGILFRKHTEYEFNLVLNRPRGERICQDFTRDRDEAMTKGQELAGMLRVPLLDHTTTEDEE
jgi:hypothetical protein